MEQSNLMLMVKLFKEMLYRISQVVRMSNSELMEVRMSNLELMEVGLSNPELMEVLIIIF